MDQFVRVRIVKGNGLDLSLFQFDYDLTFSVMFLNADRTIYGRYGTRTSKEGSSDIAMEGLREAMLAVLKLHRNYPASKPGLVAKRGPKPRYPTPERYPSLAKQYGKTLNYQGKVTRSCIHCHMARTAEREVWRAAGKPLPERWLNPWPLPASVGLRLDPKKRATVVKVLSGSPAAKAGFRRGDRIEQAAGQPLISVADLQWVLHQAGRSARIKTRVRRAGKALALTLVLAADWRRNNDFAWRESSWGLRRMTLGGMRLEPISEAERRRLRIPRGRLALRVKHLGRHGPHGAAWRAGARKGDILWSFDGQLRLTNEWQVMAYAMRKAMKGRRVLVKLLRKGQVRAINLPMQ